MTATKRPGQPDGDDMPGAARRWQATYRDSQDGNSATGVVMEASSATGATMTATE